MQKRKYHSNYNYNPRQKLKAENKFHLLLNNKVIKITIQLESE